MVIINQHEHNEISWTTEKLLSLKEIEQIIQAMRQPKAWSRQMTKKDKRNLSVFDTTNKPFIGFALKSIEKEGMVRCKTSYERLMCYLLAKILGMKTTKVIKTKWERVGCKNGMFGNYGECECNEIHRIWNCADGTLDYDDYEMVFDLPLSRVIGVRFEYAQTLE
jgi:hypothetical protein